MYHPHLHYKVMVRWEYEPLNLTSNTNGLWVLATNSGTKKKIHDLHTSQWWTLYEISCNLFIIASCRIEQMWLITWCQVVWKQSGCFLHWHIQQQYCILSRVSLEKQNWTVAYPYYSKHLTMPGLIAGSSNRRSWHQISILHLVWRENLFKEERSVIGLQLTVAFFWCLEAWSYVLDYFQYMLLKHLNYLL